MQQLNFILSYLLIEQIYVYRQILPQDTAYVWF